MSKLYYQTGSTASFSNPLSTEFDGVNEYVTYGAASGMVSAGQGSISIWVKFLSLPASGTRFVFTDTGGFVQLVVSPVGSMQFRVFSGSTVATVAHTATTNQWYHVVCSWANGTKVNMWVDGVLHESAGNSGNISNLAFDFRTGGQSVAASFLSIRINVWEVWSVKLSASEVAELFQTPPVNPATTSMAASLTHSYRSGNGDTYPTITDRTGSRNGTMTNMEAGDFVSDTP